MKKFARAMGAAAAAGAVLVGGLFLGGAVFASGKSPTTGGAEERGPLGGVVHVAGTWTFLDGTTRKLSADLGEITAVKDGTITLRRADGTSVDVPTADSTCVRNDGALASVADLRTGERALAIQENGAAVAVRAGDRPPAGGDAAGNAPHAGARPVDLRCMVLAGAVHGELTVRFADGSTKNVQVDRGMISGLSDGTVSVLRRDGATVSSTFDGATRVALDCERATSSDLKVGQVASVISENGHAVRISAMDGLERLRALRPNR